MDLSEDQCRLLRRMRKGVTIFSGFETPDEQLAMLQLYTAKLVVQLSNRYRRGVMEWRLTPEGERIARELG
ncbi:hypothetical protein [Methylobacterium planeticum]|uniref:MarR family transcriptional regulator n=1 Tax=Methylobacterium planeticum TaxID=2615211 RepID=A0A6N6MS01_9HYPH|nr:hypothetical protein [Methylobacterium planeticum]KAB1074605.1 hypothetical protein F6X51_05585 [Methylobacterium planeticum]